MNALMFLARHPAWTALGIAGMIVTSALTICLVELAGTEAVEP